MAIILSLETSTPTCSVALHQDEKLLALQEVHLEKSHSSLLNVMIHDILAYGDISRQMLDAVAISMGPGSYTGLRIGTSVAKGLCFALDLPLIAVNTLSAMAWQANRFNMHGAYLCPMIDARRMEVYCLVENGNQKELMETTALIVEEDSLKEFTQKNELWYFGNGAAKCQEILSRSERCKFIPGINPSAEAIGALALPRFKRQQLEDVAYFAPFYLKEFRTTKPKNN